MPALSTSTPPFVKLLLMGNSGTGKTGALASLVKAGYRIHVLDYDNKIEGGILPQLLTTAELSRVDFLPLRDKMVATGSGATVNGMPKAFADGMRALDKWEDGTNPSNWGGDHILVVDTLTFMAEAAHLWGKALNPNSAKEPRAGFYTAQDQVLAFLSLLTGPTFRTNVIVNAHISYQALIEGTTKGFPTSIGVAIGPKIPGFFEHLGVIDQKKISFIPSSMIDAKTPLLSLTSALPRETGLATFFEAVRKTKPQT